jgi:hypothetical protein
LCAPTLARIIAVVSRAPIVLSTVPSDLDDVDHVGGRAFEPAGPLRARVSAEVTATIDAIADAPALPVGG